MLPSVQSPGTNQLGGDPWPWRWRGASAASSVRKPLPGHGLFRRARGGDLESQLGGPGRLKEHHLDRMEALPERDLALTFTPVVCDGLARDAELGAVVGGEIEG